MTSAAAIGSDNTTYRRRAYAWAMYDWANSAVVTVIIAAVFPIFFNSIAQGEVSYAAASAFSFAVTISLLLSAVVGPIVGTLADIVGGRKRLLIICTVIGSIAVCAMYTLRTPVCLSTNLGPNVPLCAISYVHSGMWIWATVIFVVMQIFLNTSLALYDALLSHVATSHDLDRVSALGYALGYLGGGIALAIGLALILAPKVFGLAGTEVGTRLALLLTGLWWFVFSFPLFIVVPEPPATPLETGATQYPLLDSFRRMGQTFHAIRQYRELFKMLLAFWLYSDGIGTIIQLATTYGKQQIGLSQSTLIGALLLTQIVALPYALMFGQLTNDQSKLRSFYLSFIVWTAATLPIIGAYAASTNGGQGTTTGTTFMLLAGDQVIGGLLSWVIGRKLVQPFAEHLTTKRAVIIGLVVYSAIAVWGYFLNTAAEFWLLAWMVGTVQGGTQALSRSLYSTLSPRSKSGEFFGFYGFSDKFAGILGPLLFGIIGLATGGNLRYSILSVVIFFIAGAGLLVLVNEKVGAAHANEEDQQSHYDDHLADVNQAKPA